MADKNNSEDGPSLEMPSLGSFFRRSKKPASAAAAPPSTPTVDAPPSAADFERLVRGDEADQAPVDESGGHEATARAAAEVAEVAEPSTEVAEPVAVEAPAAELPDEALASVKPGVSSDGSRADVASTMVLEDLPEHDLIDPEEEPDLEDLVDDSDTSTDESVAKAPRRARSLGDLKFALPALDGRIAAAITGAIVGLLAVGLTYAGMESCEAVRGTSSCGGSGVGILVVIMIALVIFGGALLAAWKVTDPTSTSFLAVGLLAVIALLFLIDVIFEKSMIVVIPAVSVATYLLSHFVTSRFIEDE